MENQVLAIIAEIITKKQAAKVRPPVAFGNEITELAGNGTDTNNKINRVLLRLEIAGTVERNMTADGAAYTLSDI